MDGSHSQDCPGELPWCKMTLEIVGETIEMACLRTVAKSALVVGGALNTFFSASGGGGLLFYFR